MSLELIYIPTLGVNNTRYNSCRTRKALCVRAESRGYICETKKSKERDGLSRNSNRNIFKLCMCCPNRTRLLKANLRKGEKSKIPFSSIERHGDGMGHRPYCGSG